MFTEKFWGSPPRALILGQPCDLKAVRNKDEEVGMVRMERRMGIFIHILIVV